MSEKLTLADIMKYPEAKILQGGFVHYGILQLYDEVIKECNDLEYGEPLDEIHHNIEECQLVLRSIDELTDAEKKCIDNICGKLSWENWQRSFEGIYTILSNKKILELFDYLRSRNIDIDGFIENGKAVKS